jgi:DNA-directed RNA polymerases I, II, and III subunit RPABC2
MNLSDDEVSVSSLVSNEEQAPIAPKDNNEEDLYGSDDDDGVPPPPPPPEDDEESDDEQSIKSIDDEDNISEPDENSNMELLNYGSDYNESDEDSDDEDDNYLQKLDDLNKKNIIKEHHPDLLHHNHSEIEAFTRIVRNEKGNIVDPLHKTLPFITKYEKARILGERAKQINMGAKPLIEIGPEIIDGYLIAEKEYSDKKIPFIIKRPMPNGGCEYWKFKDLEII